MEKSDTSSSPDSESVPKREKSTKALISGIVAIISALLPTIGFSVGVIWWVLFCLICMGFGIAGLREIKKQPDRFSGRGFAIGGVIYACLLLLVFAYSWATAPSKADQFYSMGKVTAEGREFPIQGRESIVIQSDDEAVGWFRMAANLGHAKAQSSLGKSYANGLGAPQNNLLAYMWFGLAAENGEEAANKEKEQVARQMSEDDLSKAQAMIDSCLASQYKNCEVPK